jgi:hypothetical protein
MVSEAASPSLMVAVQILIVFIQSATEQGWICQRYWNVQDRFPMGEAG